MQLEVKLQSYDYFMISALKVIPPWHRLYPNLQANRPTFSICIYVPAIDIDINGFDGNSWLNGLCPLNYRRRNVCVNAVHNGFFHNVCVVNWYKWDSTIATHKHQRGVFVVDPAADLKLMSADTLQAGTPQTRLLYCSHHRWDVATLVVGVCVCCSFSSVL